MAGSKLRVFRPARVCEYFVLFKGILQIGMFSRDFIGVKNVKKGCFLGCRAFAGDFP